MAYFSRIEKPKIVLKAKEVPEQNKKIEPPEKTGYEPCNWFHILMLQNNIQNVEIPQTM